MIFRRPSTRYGQTPAAETAYTRAASEWDARLGSARVQASNWRLIAFGELLVIAGLVGAYVHLAERGTIEPWVVQIDKTGAVQAVAPAADAYKPTDAQIAYHLGRWIQNVRSLSMDAIIVRQAWLEAFALSAGGATNRLKEHARENDPFARVGTVAVSVEIVSVVRQSPDTFQVRWKETRFEHGAKAAEERWTALLTTTHRKPRTPDALRTNPLGIYVIEFSWSREMA